MPSTVPMGMRMSARMPMTRAKVRPQGLRCVSARPTANDTTEPTREMMTRKLRGAGDPGIVGQEGERCGWRRLRRPQRTCRRRDAQQEERGEDAAKDSVGPVDAPEDAKPVDVARYAGRSIEAERLPRRRVERGSGQRGQNASATGPPQVGFRPSLARLPLLKKGRWV